jgi:HemY protein
MMRIFFGLFVLLGLAICAALIANLPGEVRFSVSGYVVETRTAVLAGAGFAVFLAAMGLVGLGQFLWHLPANLRAERRENQRRDGEAALAKALMALARGDAASARGATRLARQKLPHQALPRLMAAQAALLDGRQADAEADYRAMLRRETSLEQKTLGLEGLYYMARGTAVGDMETAGTYALQVLELAPRTLWALDGLTAMAVQIGDWSAAQDWLRQWSKALKGNAKRAEVRRRRAVLSMAEAQSLLVTDDPADQLAAQKKAEQAVKQEPAFFAASALAARLQARGGNLKKARGTLRQAWTRAPHSEIAEAWLDCYADQPLATRQRAATSFIGKHKAHEEAHILRARIALEGERWLLAKTLLAPHANLKEDNLAKDKATRRLCLLMAQAEEGLGELQNAQLWRERARRAPSEAGWMSAGLRLDSWQALCPVTGKLDGVSWQSPMEASISQANLAAPKGSAPLALS